MSQQSKKENNMNDANEQKNDGDNLDIVQEDWSKLKGCMFTQKDEIGKLMMANAKYQKLANKKNGGTVICEIGSDCIKISGDCGASSKIKQCLMNRELNLKKFVDYPENVWVNNFCAIQIVLKEIVEGCKVLNVRLEIKIVSGDRF